MEPTYDATPAKCVAQARELVKTYVESHNVNDPSLLTALDLLEKAIELLIKV